VCNPGVLDRSQPLYQQYLAAASSLQFCDCPTGQQKQRWLQRLQAQHQSDADQLIRARSQAEHNRRQRLFDDAGVPPKFLGYTWESYLQVAGQERGKQMLINAIEAYLANGYVQTSEGIKAGLFVHGKSDQGKTGALSQVFLHYLRQGAAGLWVQYNSLLRELRNFEDGHVDERINQCKYVEYLFIDDFGDPLANQASAYSRDVMMQIIDYRNNYRKPVLITSNLTLDELAQQYHARLVKRLLENCFVVEVTGNALGILRKR
jgi:DNA replication protein DnaC